MAGPQIPPPNGLSQLPADPVSGIYFLWSGFQIVYVGQSRNVTQRIYQHIEDGVKSFDGMSFIEVKPSKLLKVERYFIEKLLPRYNQCTIANSMRRLRRHGFTGVTEPLTAVEKAARYLGITVEALQSLGIEETIKVRIPRKSARRTIKVWKTERLRSWADANPELLRSLRA